MTTTYGDMRTEREKIIDAAAKERVQRGIAVLEEKYGPEWVDRIDLDIFNLEEPTMCVLGQVYADSEVPDDLWEAFIASPLGHCGTNPWGTLAGSGYVKGMAILDGDVIAESNGPELHGFNTPDRAIGMIDNDAAEYEGEGEEVYLGFAALEEVWRDEIASRKRSR